MDTEQQQTDGQQQGIQPNGQVEDDGQPAGDEEPPQGDGQQAQPEQGQQDGEPPRRSRRERQQERRGIVQERDELRSKVGSLEALVAKLTQGQQQTNEGVSRLTETLGKALPQEKSRVEQLEEDIDKLLPTVGESPVAYRQWKALQRQLTDAIADEAVSRHMQKFREEMPRQPSPAEAELVRQYPWVQRNPAAARAVESTIRHLASDGRDMGDPEIREATFLEAGATIAQAWKLPTRAGRDGNQAQRFASGSGRGGAPGTGPTGGYVMTDEDWSMARMAYPHLPPKEQEKRFRATLEREMKTRR